MGRKFFQFAIVFVSLLIFVACSLEILPTSESHDKMIRTLRKIQQGNYGTNNPFTPKARLPYLDSLLASQNTTSGEKRLYNYRKAVTLLELGREKESINILERLVKDEHLNGTAMMKKELAMAYMRHGERSNCVMNHAAESCILPIKGLGIHHDPSGSRMAINLYEDILSKDPSDLESRWLLNIAYMTLGEYPRRVPREFLVPGLQEDSSYQINPFEDIAGDLELDERSMAGGSITEDFDNDGYLDIVTSSWILGDKMHFFKNNGNGTFANTTARSGLDKITGGLNMVQADYNNDGFTDILVLRGAWKRKFGKEPNSLLRNNGDGTFTDVTMQSGLLSFHPTQTATFNDFNNDGWLDLFIGNETDGEDSTAYHPSELYMNNQDGTFKEIAALAKCDVANYVKGVASGDYNNDGWQDIFLSTQDGGQKLLKNKGTVGNQILFEDVTEQAGLSRSTAKTFTTWFWDYNNDGWPDILTVDYSFEKSLAYYAAAEKLGVPTGDAGKILLFKNNHDGTFTNVAKDVGLDQIVFSMGGNFGDIDNDGFLDMYLGTGNPKYQSIIPNKMFKGVGGKKFIDVTAAARVGHLQKGHGVSFADMDNDGDQDIYAKMGGAYPGDAYQNSFFLNPGQNNNKWIALNLEGTTSNRSAIGSRVKVTFRENGIKRSVYRDVNSGGSFGASPLRKEIGLGQTENIDELEIQWSGSNKVQRFYNVNPNQFIKITEGKDEIETLHPKKIDWILRDRLCYPLQPTSRVHN